MGQHPPAPRGHVQEELHECQQVVVVIRCSTQGAAQLPELRGAQRASSLASRGRAPPTLTSHQPTKQGGLESRGVDRWSSVGPAGGRESTLATSQVKPGAWALTQGSTVPFPATLGCSPGAGAEAAGDQSWAAGGVWCPGQLGIAAQSGPEGSGQCRPLAGPVHTVSGTGEEKALGQGCLPGTASSQLCWEGAEKSNAA